MLGHVRDFARSLVLLLTVHDSEAETDRALGLGADDYLAKPFDPVGLLARLKALERTDREDRVDPRHMGRGPERRVGPPDGSGPFTDSNR